MIDSIFMFVGVLAATTAFGIGITLALDAVLYFFQKYEDKEESS